jgi:DNA-binding transcriptional LysR family regulator
LTAFGRVVECGGFSAAARRLNMSVTMVSSHVQALEDRLGVRLLNRTTRKVSLTEIGKAYYERSSQILADLEEADRVAGALQATPQGTLRLYTSAALVRFLAPIISEFLRLHPAVSIEFTTGERMVDLVEEGFDLAIRPLPPPDSSLIVRHLTPWRNVLCCSTSYLEIHEAPRRPSDLALHNCLRYAFYPSGDEWRFEGPSGEPVSVRVSGNVVTNSAGTLRHLALDGHGLFLAPPFVVADDLREKRLVPLLEDYRPIEFVINAIYPHRHHLSTKVRSFIDLLTERFAEHRKQMDSSVSA